MSRQPWHLLYAARIYMSVRECWLTDRRKEIQEEVVADLHSCLEQLTFRCTEMELKIEKCKQSALYHMQLSKKEAAPSGVARERARARMYMQDRQRLQSEHDKALRSMHMLQQQIDSIVSSHVDMVIVDAMRGFNATAARMALPQKTAEIEKLGESLADRNHEASSLQEAMSAFTIGDDEEVSSDDYMMRELDALLDMPISPRAQLPAIPSTPTIEKTELTVTMPLAEAVPVPLAVAEAVPVVPVPVAEAVPVPVAVAEAVAEAVAPVAKQLITVLASAQFN